MAFIFADLIIVPIILIYRKYYGTRLAPRNVSISYLMTVTGGYLIERIFRGLGLVPAARSAKAAKLRCTGTTWRWPPDTIWKANSICTDS